MDIFNKSLAILRDQIFWSFILIKTDKRSSFEIIKNLKEKFLKNNQNLGSFEIGFTYTFDKATIVVENIKEKEKYNNPNITTYTKVKYSNSMSSNELILLWNKHIVNCRYNFL